MDYHEFVVPSDAEMLGTLGVSPEAAQDDPMVRSFRLTSESGDEVLISYDVPGRSFRVQVISRNAVRVDLLRESATSLTVSSKGRTVSLNVVVQSASLSGELEVQVGSAVVVRDQLLMV